MNTALLWKEWREQRTFAIAVLAFGMLAMTGMAILVEPSRGNVNSMGPREMMPIAVAYLAGTVCGAMLIADEKEVGTMEFLDTMPAKRRHLWQSKMIFGMTFSMVQCLLIGITGVALGCFDQQRSPLTWVMLSVIIGWVAFAWGCFGGATANSTLAAVFQGAFGCAICAFCLSVPVAFILGPNAASTGLMNSNVRATGVVALTGFCFMLLWVGIGLLGSLYFFTALDRDRNTVIVVKQGQSPRRRSRKPNSIRSLFWLSLRQSRVLMYILLGMSVLMGGVMLAPDTQPLFMWPIVTLIFVVLAGVTIFTEEQGKGIARFWSERRLPIGRLWLVKIAVHLMLAVIAGLIMLIVMFAYDSRRPFRSELFTILRGEQLRFLLLAVVYGFVCAHLMSLLFRKTIVAGLVAVMLSITMAGSLIPSLLGGGAYRWQIWLPALMLLITARLMLYPWAHGRILTRTPLLRASTGITLAIMTLIGGLCYRIVEIPDTTDRLDEAQFVENLPNYDVNEAGILSRSAASQFHRAMVDARSAIPNANTTASVATQAPLDRLRNYGWSSETADLKPWLDRIFADPWMKYLDEAATKPTGIFDDPRDVDVLTPLETTEHAREMIIVMRARGLQVTDEGRPEEFIRIVRGGMVTVRATRNKCCWPTVQRSYEMEVLLLASVQQWLVRVAHRPELLRAMLAELQRHEREMPVGSDDVFWADQVMVRNTHSRVANWLPKLLRFNPTPTPGAPDPSDAQADFVGICWAFPWERIRRERIHRCLTQPERLAKTSWFSPLHLMELVNREAARNVERQDRVSLTLRRLRLLETALRLYHAEHKTFPTTLTELTPAYLPSIPTDPFGTTAIQYRRSTGEHIEIEEYAARLWLPNESIAIDTLSHFANPLAGFVGLHELATYPAVASEALRPEGPGPPMPHSVSFQRGPATQRRLITLGEGSAVLWSVGSDGTNDGGRLSARQGVWQTQQGEDWIVVVPHR